MTPSDLAKLAGVTPNMIYTYMRHGRIEFHIDHTTGQKYIDDEYGAQWAHEHVTRRNTRRENRRALLDAQLKGWT